jgi:hypothetical protein
METKDGMDPFEVGGVDESPRAELVDAPEKTVTDGGVVV